MPESNKLTELVERFDRNREAYLSGQYNETRVRVEFIDPFFTLLGWDVHNNDGHAEAYKDVYHEDAIKIGGATKAPDYSFRIGGTRKFFLEAKKPSVNIKEDISPAYQLRRYAWSAKLPLSILTDFEELAVYDCRVKPAEGDKASTARIQYLKYTEYAEKWDEIYSIFSKDAVLKGSFDKYAESNKAKKGTTEVDTAFLREMETWRENLARNLALRNSQLGKRDLNFAVQKILDRIIFLRMCEDRGIEFYGQLQGLQNGPHIYPRLCQLFRNADDRYNSGLFHFKEEKGRPTLPDPLTLNLSLDDKILKDILKSLYYPQSPYEFSVLPTEILGQVYEQFLGKVIRLTAGHRAIVEEKPEVKKAGGVYYTPAYIVNYIVKQTIGKMLEGKKPGARSAVNKIKILDPACGSGSFLIGAYQFLLDWYRDRYVEMDPKKHKKVLYQGPGDEWRLTTAERKRILLTHIYGVDIDPQAVETTKLSLLLKVLEGESGETLKRQFQLFHERALPDLGDNIKCGNSLIGPDFYDHQQSDLFDDDERYRINVFDWQAEFREIMQAGGFDAVIGNPPYVRQEILGENFKDYAKRKFSVYAGTADLYSYFIERGVALIKTGGCFSYIVANKWMRANYGKPLRQWMKQQSLEAIIDFGDLPVFQQATTYPCIIKLTKGTARRTFDVAQIDTLDFSSLESYVRDNRYAVKRSGLDDNGWSLSNESQQNLLSKLKQRGTPLGEYVEGEIYYGIKTGLNKAFVIDRETRDRLIAEDSKSQELIKPFLVGKDIKRYQPPKSERFLILIPKGWTRIQSKNAKDPWGWLNKNYRPITEHFKPFETAAKKRCDQGEYWWELRACDYYEEFEKPKIIIPSIVKNPSFTFDKEKFFSNDKTSIISTKNLYLLGILNSKIIDCFMRSISSTKQGGYFEYKPMYVQQLPIRTIDSSNAEDKARHDQMVQMVERMLDLNKKLATANTNHDKTVLQRQIDATDNQIDRLVYELYGLTEAEIAIVEESVNK
jgi:Eco57I restriction-modification methylase/restriction endonuclease TaqI-like protein/type I restriction and modification enzyme subunit R-like protein